MLTASLLDGDKQLASLELRAKSFISGTAGYSGKGKVEIDGKKYSVALSLIEV